MSIKIVTATAFSAAIEVDEQNKIVRTPRGLSNFLNLPLSILEATLRKNKFQYFKIEDTNE
jgi:hypothetical protein